MAGWLKKAAWKKANHVLAGILAGYAADPPGVQFCYQSLNAKGEPAFDGQGIPLLDCNRGTNDVDPKRSPTKGDLKGLWPVVFADAPSEKKKDAHRRASFQRD